MTNDPDTAAQEGLPWVAPVDPPVVADHQNPEGVDVAAGFGMSAESDPYDSDHEDELLTNEDEFVALVRDALRADSATSQYADTLAIAHRSGIVAVRGVVDDLDDTDAITEVVTRVRGVTQVIDELDVHGVTD